jgi:hypothetical protein
VDNGAHLHCDWHPLIPFGEARIDQRIDVTIAGGAVPHPTARTGSLAAVGCRRHFVSRNDPDQRSTNRAGALPNVSTSNSGRPAGLRAAVDRLDERALLARLMSAFGPLFHRARRWVRDFSARLWRVQETLVIHLDCETCWTRELCDHLRWHFVDHTEPSGTRFSRQRTGVVYTLRSL